MTFLQCFQWISGCCKCYMHPTSTLKVATMIYIIEFRKDMIIKACFGDLVTETSSLVGVEREAQYQLLGQHLGRIVKWQNNNGE